MFIDEPRGGRRAAVVLLHASASSRRQWLPIMPALQQQFDVLAPDLYGHGQTPAWQHEDPMRLADEAERIEALLNPEQPVHLVGHSYGGAVALALAQRARRSYRSLWVYEPVLFSLIAAPAQPEVLALRESVARLKRYLHSGQAQVAAALFIGYWSGAGAWETMAPGHQAAVAARMPTIVAQFDALLNANITADHLAALSLPVQLTLGRVKIGVVRAIARSLRAAWPQMRPSVLRAADHMTPVTQPQRVNARIAAFIAAAEADAASGADRSATHLRARTSASWLSPENT